MTDAPARGLNLYGPRLPGGKGCGGSCKDLTSRQVEKEGLKNICLKLSAEVD